MRLNARLPYLLAACAAAVALALPGAALAQKKKKETPPPKEDKPADGAAPEGELTPQQQAVEAYKEGKAHQDAKEWDQAIAKYQEAYEHFADPNLFLAIGEVYRLKGADDTELADFKTDLGKSIEFYQKYLDAVPEGQSDALDQQRAAAQQRIDAINEALEKAEKEEQERLEAERKEKEEKERKEKEKQERLRKQKEAREGTQFALDGLLIAGVQDDLTGIGRLVAGGMVGWGAFALEAHLAFDAFLRLDSAEGVSGRSVTLADVGARVSTGNNRFVGPFVSGGVGLGFFSGSPRERKVADDMSSCPNQDPDGNYSCAFNVDRNLTTRFGVGWGFETNKDTTVAVRLDLSYIFYSVDGKQPPGAPRAIDVEKPQGGPSVLVGFEFMRW